MSFSLLLGQPRAVALLRGAVARGTVASGYLFVGPEGVGKATAALSFAQALECERRQPGQGDGCGECSQCQKVEHRSHPDVHWVVPDGAFIKIDQIRELKSRLSLRAHEGRVKLSVIEEVERFHPAAANALLKTLEEPSADTCFVLLAKSARFVLPTIRSRCQAVRFTPLAEEDIEAILARSAVDPSAAATAARFSEGSVGRAKTSLDAPDELRRRVELARRIEDAAAAPDPMLGIEVAEELGKKLDRQEALATLDLLALSYRDAVCEASGAPRPHTEGPRRPLRLARAISCVEAVRDARDAISRNANAHLVAEDLLFSLRRHTGATKIRGRS